MNGSNRKSNQTDYKFKWTPQPIYHCDFHIPWRQAGFGYKAGDGGMEASIQVALQREVSLIQGNADIQVNINGVDAPHYGLINAPGTNLQPGAISDWANAANKGVVYAEYVGLITEMFGTDRSAQTPGSILMVVANDVFTQLQLVADAGNSERTNFLRLMDHVATKEIIPSQFLPDGAVLLIEASPLNIRIPRSADITVAPWLKTHDMDDSRFTVMAASTLQVREDRNSRAGILYATK